MTDIFKIKIPGNPAYIQIAKMAIGSASAIEGFDFECIEDIKIAVAEACKIVTCHGSPGWSESYEVCCSRKGDAIIINVTDFEGTHGVKKTEKRPCLDCSREGDLSLQVIKSLMDEVEIIPMGKGYKSIIMVKKYAE